MFNERRPKQFCCKFREKMFLLICVHIILTVCQVAVSLKQLLTFHALTSPLIILIVAINNTSVLD